MNHEEEQLLVMCSRVTEPDGEVKKQCRRRWDSIAKPIDGLGRLEELVTRIAAIQNKVEVTLERTAVVVFCGDNGIVEEGVTQTDQHVTAVVTGNIARGVASINRMAAVAGAEVFAVDMGVAEDLTEPGIFKCKIARGTANFIKAPAMTREEAVRGILEGIRIAGDLKGTGYDILATGEMGIGNTTTASAVASVMLNLPAEAVTGRGAGLSGTGLKRKIEVIKEGIRKHNPDREDPLAVLSTLGGFDLAGICGLFLGGAIYRIPVVLDGMISAVAALLAARICPAAALYMIPSHCGKEPASRLIMKELSLSPVIEAELGLGEGTGAVLLFPMLSMALEVYRQNSTFSDINIEAYHTFED